MATDHRGNIIGNPMTGHGGHRPTPRINKALQNYFKIDEGTAGHIISEHRAGNEYLDDDYYGIEYPHEAYALGGQYDPNQHGQPDEDNIGSRIGSIPDAISEAVSARSGKNAKGYSSPYEKPPTVKGP